MLELGVDEAYFQHLRVRLACLRGERYPKPRHAFGVDDIASANNTAGPARLPARMMRGLLQCLSLPPLFPVGQLNPSRVIEFSFAPKSLGVSNSLFQLSD